MLLLLLLTRHYRVKVGIPYADDFEEPPSEFYCSSLVLQVSIFALYIFVTRINQVEWAFEQALGQV